MKFGVFSIEKLQDASVDIELLIYILFVYVLLHTLILSSENSVLKTKIQFEAYSVNLYIDFYC